MDIKFKKIQVLLYVLLAAMGWLATETKAAALFWQTSKQAAMEKAIQEGKLVLLLAGRTA